jgi:hypothetical protein
MHLSCNSPYTYMITCLPHGDMATGRQSQDLFATLLLIPDTKHPPEPHS